MRALLLTLALLFSAAPALAQYWGHYANARFGYEIDIPPGFEGNGESDNGDGQIFYDLAGEQGLTVWGGHLPDGFEQAVADALAAAQADNLMVTDQSSTPQWASFSAQRDHRLVLQRMIALCDGASYAAFRIEFNIRDLGRMDDVVRGLARSFVPVGC